MGNLLLRAKNGLWGVVSRGYVCVWGADVDLLWGVDVEFHISSGEQMWNNK